MEAGTTSTTLTARLLILNLGEYDLWLMWIEQYFLMTDYSLWEVILSGSTKVPLYKDAKLLMEAIEKRYGGNKESKKVQRTLLKQQYENFAGSSSKTMDQTFDRNKEEIETINLDDLYNNLKIYEPELTGSSSTSQNPQNVAFVSFNSTNNHINSSTHEVDNTAFGVSAAHTQSNPTSGDNLSDVVICMRARKYYQRTGKKITINGSDTVGYDKSKLILIGALWQKRNFEALKTQLDNLRVEFNKSEFNIATYKRGLTSVEEQLIFYKKNEVMFCDQISVLKRDASFKDLETNALKIEIEKLKNENESNQIKIDKFENASKCLDKLIGSQISNNSRKGMGYNAVPPPPTGLFAPPTIDLLNSNTSNKVKKTPDTLLVKELVSKKGKQTVFPTKIEFVKQQDKTARKPVKPNSAVVNAVRDNQANAIKASACLGNPPTDDQGYMDSGCSRHMTGNISYLLDFQEFNGGYVTFGGRANRGKITSKGTLKTCKLDFQDVFFVKELKFNLFSISHICDKKNCVLFTDIACYVLSPDFKLPDASLILLEIPRKNNMYSVDMKNIVPKESLTCLVAKATLDESMLWHRRACRFTWVFFLASKDETSGILKSFITEIENLVDKKVKIIRSDNGTEFKNRVMNEFYEQKGIKREYNSKLPTTFWAEAVNTACCVKNRVIIVKPHNKTPYELFRDYLGKFDGKSDDGFFVGYSLTSKAFRVYNIRTRKVEENLHSRFLEDKPIVLGDGPKWLFDIDSLTKSMNYVLVIAGTNSNDFAGSEVSISEGSTSKEMDTSQDSAL
ncbi:putative ribonuclease H-like domain-containing protein [Tanacetum coccineum]|uniref:Ribonuclease H-like domain-containing protein n=1 Tax=Tanacetum coccineum TaxID=301880 RepID=A0ABQ5GMT5_9ASTR